MSSSDAQQFLKLEDLHTSSSPSASYDDSTAHTPDLMQTTPPPVIVHSKAAKKRKSWGQELPEPKTALPPRKRAKTDDEKEQRRIERIKRNRAAAHNSRERKRQETETLAVALARANAEIEAYRKLHGPLPASVVLPEISLCIDSDDTPTPSLIESHGTAEAALSPASPAEDLFDFDAPIKQEPSDYTLAFPPAFDNLSSKPSPLSLSPLDPTQHSAVSVEQQPESDSAAQPPPLHPYLVEPHFPLPHEHATVGLLQDYDAGALDGLAFAHGAYDASFNPPLDFSFDDFIHDSATVAVDGSGAA